MTVTMVAIPFKAFLQIDAVRMQVLNALRSQGRETRREFWKTTATFTNKPEFKIKVELKRTRGYAAVHIYTEDENYRRLDEGTPDHFVPRVGRRRMVFQPGYKRKTTPRKISSKSGGSFGPVIARTGRWKVKGIEAGEFSKTIGDELQKSGKFRERIQDAINKGLEKSNLTG